MKQKRDTPKPVRREVFVLTPEEKKTVSFVVIALVLGLATKHYRDMHPPRPPKPAIRVNGKASPRPVSRQTPVSKAQPSAVQDD